MPVNRKRVGKEEAKSLFLKYYNNSPSSMVRDINTKAKTLKPNAKNSWKYRNNPSKYDMKGIDDNSNASRQWIMNRFFRHMNTVPSPKTTPSEEVLASLKTEIENSKSIIKQLTSQIKGCQEDKKNADSTIKSTYNASIAELKKQVQEQKTIIASLKESIAAHEQRVATLKSEYENNVSQAMAKAEQEYSEVIKGIKQDHQAAILQLKKEKEVISNELSQLQAVLKEETNNKTAIQTELTAVKAQLAEEKNKLNSLEIQNKQLRQQGKAASNNIASELQSKEQAISGYVAQIARLQERIAKQDAALNTMQKTIFDLANKNDKEIVKAQRTAQRIGDLEKRNELLQAKKNELEASVTNLTREIENLKAEILNKSNEYSSLEKACNKERQELENKYIQELQAKEALNQKVKEITQDKRDKEGLIATLRAQIRNLKETSKDTQQASKELNERIQELETEQTIREQNAVNAQKNYEKQLSNIKAKLQESDALIMQSNQKISQNIETIKSKEQEINTLNDRVKELQTKKPQSSSNDDLFEVLLNFEKVLFNINGNKGAGIVKVEKFKKDPKLALELKDRDFYMLRIDTKDNSQNNDLYISISKYLIINRYDKTSYEIIPANKKETYRFKIVQPKAMTTDIFKDQMKAFNTLLKSTTNFNDKYKLKNNLKIK